MKREDSERQTRVLLEVISSKVDGVMEQYGHMAEDITGLRTDVAELKADMAIVKPAVKEHSRLLVEIKSELRDVNKRLIVVESR